MTRATHRSVTLIVLVLVVCAGPWGCALKHPQGPQAPTDEVRAQPIDVTYSLRRYGASLIGSGLGADNRVETLMLMRAAGQ